MESQTRGRGRPRHDDILTPAEWRIANAVRHGMSNRVIAVRLGVSPDAVKFHIGNILGKLGLESRAGLRLWSGAPKQSAVHYGGGLEMTGNIDGFGEIGQIARNVDDLDRAEAWYRDVLGLPHLFRAGFMSFFDCGGIRLMLQKTDSPADGYIIYFRVTNIMAKATELESRGVTFIAAPHMVHRHDDATEEWMAFFNDDAGRPLAIMSQVRPAG